MPPLKSKCIQDLLDMFHRYVTPMIVQQTQLIGAQPQHPHRVIVAPALHPSYLDAEGLIEPIKERLKNCSARHRSGNGKYMAISGRLNDTGITCIGPSVKP